MAEVAYKRMGDAGTVARLALPLHLCLTITLAAVLGAGHAVFGRGAGAVSTAKEGNFGGQGTRGGRKEKGKGRWSGVKLRRQSR